MKTGIKILLSSLVLVLSVICLASKAPIPPDPNLPQNEALNDSLNLILKAHKYDDAVKMLDNAIFLYPDNSFPYYKLGIVYSIYLSNYRKSIKYLEKSLSLYPDFIGAEVSVIIGYLIKDDRKNLSKHLEALHRKQGMGDFYEDYNKNVLLSLKPDAIIFTNGDMDTYPLWYWQYAKGLRQDVTVINLSLLNTSDFIQYLRSKKPGIEINLSSGFVDSLCDKDNPASFKLRSVSRGKKQVKIETMGGDFEWELPATKFSEYAESTSDSLNCIRVQDYMIMEIMKANSGTKPIYFAASCSKLNLIGLDPYLVFEGLVFRLKPGKEFKVDYAKLEDNLFNKYEYQYCQNFQQSKHLLRDPWYDGPLYPAIENEQKLAQNYRSAFLHLAYNYFKADESGAEFDDSLSLKGNYENFAQLSSSAKMYVTLKWMEESIPTETIKWNNSELLVQVGRLYYDKGYYEAGIRSFKSALSLKPDDLQAHYMLALTYKKLGDEALFQEEYLQVKQLSPEEAEKLLSEP